MVSDLIIHKRQEIVKGYSYERPKLSPFEIPRRKLRRGLFYTIHFFRSLTSSMASLPVIASGISSMTATRERKLSISFSLPWA